LNIRIQITRLNKEKITVVIKTTVTVTIAKTTRKKLKEALSTQVNKKQSSG